ncbi:hypothetical protein EYF80_062441 [Liparis tanakae]|uniref:Uncharacterized protein n=1 Tax=Liparis tanakae TaxID=230148 RepID=A0A4Z2EEV9_9TELE|nr:hypothetical protein EYF80_062441 [Liparis tanakae]
MRQEVHLQTITFKIRCTTLTLGSLKFQSVDVVMWRMLRIGVESNTRGGRRGDVWPPLLQRKKEEKKEVEKEEKNKEKEEEDEKEEEEDGIQGEPEW